MVVVDNLSRVTAAADLLPTLPIIGECAEQPEPLIDYSFLVERARRGLFGFDWGPVRTPPYARLTVPSKPASVASLPEAIRGAAALVLLPLDFREVPAIHVEDLSIALFGSSG